jgi:hypothetical protein
VSSLRQWVRYTCQVSTEAVCYRVHRQGWANLKTQPWRWRRQFLRNVGNQLLNHKVKQPRRPGSSVLSLKGGKRAALTKTNIIVVGKLVLLTSLFFSLWNNGMSSLKIKQTIIVNNIAGWTSRWKKTCHLSTKSLHLPQSCTESAELQSGDSRRLMRTDWYRPLYDAGLSLFEPVMSGKKVVHVLDDKT